MRDAVPDDLEAVVAIYQHEVDTGVATFETRAVDAEEWRAKITGPEPMLVAEEDGTVLGVAYASPYRARPAYDRTRETSVYLAAVGQGRGLGTALYDALLPRLRDGGFHTALAMVALPNEASVRLHERAGFERVGVLREVGHKLGRVVDVAVLQLML
ncbi:GNAT family N-acetyltransferase [Marmoricola endophyticus]|uniref:GNAT family N-acetyltransferase n=1 Tax=Marmoricola endophyticus TaxID=2040280 RepID=UPI001E4EEF06|nr:GNAT family N-acetyltransferase [Marmoricola endophyticus]